MRLALVLVLGLLCALGASAQGGLSDARRCATPEPTLAQAFSTARIVEQYRMATALGQRRRAGLVTVPVAVHVLRSGPGAGQGDVPDAWIEAQVDTLNAAFAATDLRFVLALVERVDNPDWAVGLTLGSEDERDMKEALALDPARVLNLYTASLGLDYLGWATLPETAAETDDYQGVVLLNQSLPGGARAPYNLGHTGTHEVGHWAGLYHTFSGGCTSPNDGVADTPQQRDGTSGCPRPAPDSCPSDPGLDPVHNYMDYSDDRCMTGFTDGQDVRAEAMLAAFRPTLLAGGFALATAPRPVLDELYVGIDTTVPVWVTNTTDGPVTVTGATASGAEVSLPGPVTIAPGAVARLAARVRPARSGPVTIRLATDTGVTPDLLAVSGTAVVAPTARLGSPMLAARVVEGGTTERTVVLANDGEGTLRFDLTDQPAWVDTVTPSAGTIPGGGSQALTVAFDPSGVPPGALSAPLVFATNDPVRPTVSLPLGLDVLVRPTALGVGAVYPNPGRGRIAVPLALPDDLAVWADVVDLRGRVVARIAEGETLPVGYPELTWDATGAAAGLYLVRVRTATEAAVGRVVILR